MGSLTQTLRHWLLFSNIQARACLLIHSRVYRILKLTGYARIDLRMTPEGKFYVLEANPNPQLAFGEDLAESAEISGLSYPALLNRILQLGLRAHQQWTS